MMIEYRKWIDRQMLRVEPEKLFVFGDNTQRRGMGGQAAEMRGEPNAVGIATKVSPGMDKYSFFCDGPVELKRWFEFTELDRNRLLNHAISGNIVAWPEDGIGTGLAQLEQRAPQIWNAVTKLENALRDTGIVE